MEEETGMQTEVPDRWLILKTKQGILYLISKLNIQA